MSESRKEVYPPPGLGYTLRGGTDGCMLVLVLNPCYGFIIGGAHVYGVDCIGTIALAMSGT